jgi:hypothetical protein
MVKNSLTFLNICIGILAISTTNGESPAVAGAVAVADRAKESCYEVDL